MKSHQTQKEKKDDKRLDFMAADAGDDPLSKRKRPQKPDFTFKKRGKNDLQMSILGFVPDGIDPQDLTIIAMHHYQYQYQLRCKGKL